MLGHLDLQPGLQHLTYQPRQQPAIASELATQAGVDIAIQPI